MRKVGKRTFRTAEGNKSGGDLSVGPEDNVKGISPSKILSPKISKYLPVLWVHCDS